MTWIWESHPWSSIILTWQTEHLLKSTAARYLCTCTSMWRPTSRRCLISVLFRSHTAPESVPWYYCGKRTVAWSFALTSGNWTTRLSKMHTHYLKLMRPLTACRGPSGSPHSTWNLGIGMLRWMRTANHWPISQWGHRDLQIQKNTLWVDQCPSNISAVDWDLTWGSQLELVHYLPGWHSYLFQRPHQPSQETRGHVLEVETCRTQTKIIKVWVILSKNHLLGAHHLCPRDSHWWTEDLSHCKVAYPYHHYWGPELPGIHAVLLLVHP